MIPDSFFGAMVTAVEKVQGGFVCQQEKRETKAADQH